MTLSPHRTGLAIGSFSAAFDLVVDAALSLGAEAEVFEAAPMALMVAGAAALGYVAGFAIAFAWNRRARLS